MYIIQQPDALSLSGNLKKLKVRVSEAITLQLSTGDSTILEQRYEPNTAGDIEIDLRQVVEDRLSYDLREASAAYEQAALAATFTATIGSTAITFRVVKGGVYKLQDSATNFLTQNFMTWQPTEKRVSYYTPEFLTYYATVAATVKLKAYFNNGGTVTSSTITLASLSAGKAYTIPLQYSLVSGLLGNELPAWYDVWVENGSGTRLTYVQRYVADNARSREEDWILWENSLGGLDTLRAYGPLALSFRHDHQEAAIGTESQEYRVDADRLYTKDTGKLSRDEARWVLDFFPSTAKYIYLDQAIQSIVVTDSTASGKPRTEPVSYSFTFKLSDTACLLNHARAEVPASVLDIVVPNLGNFTLAPRLAEFPTQQLSGGILFPVQNPYSEGWGTASLDALVTYLEQFGWIDTDQLGDAISGAITDLREYMEQAFRTGIITQAQAMAIEKYINVINTTMRQAEKDHESVSGMFEDVTDSDLLEAKDGLDEAYEAYVEAGTDLLDLINLVIRDNVITQEEVDAINDLYDEYNSTYADFCAALTGCQSLLIGSNTASIEALERRYLRKANTKDDDPEGDTETLPITFVPKQTLQAGFRSIASYVPGVTGKGTDLTIVNTVDGDEITATDDIFTTDFVLARKRLQSSLGVMEGAEFGTFIDGGSGFVSDFTSEDGLTAVGRGAKIYPTGDIEGGTFTSRGNVVARGVQYVDGTSVTYLTDTGEVIGYNALQAGRYFSPGAAGGGIRLNASGYGELSQLAVRSHIVNAGVFADGFFGEGFKIWNDDGSWKMAIDQLTVRQIMNVYEMLVNRIRAVGGMLVVSPASGKIKSVTTDGDFYIIRLESGNDSFEIGDLVRMQRFTGEDYAHGGVGQVVSGYWVEVADTCWECVTNHNADGIIEQTEQLIYVRKDDFGLWAIPAAGDEVVQLGNTRNPARQTLIALTANESTVSDGHGGQVGTPTIDILTGVDHRNFSGTNRTRLGYLGDIVDSAFYNITSGTIENPEGYGLYSDNAYLKGRFVLADGTDVYTMFSVQSGRFESVIGNISTSVMTDRENYLSDVVFAHRLSHWVTNKDSLYFQQPLQSWILANGGVLSYDTHKVSVKSHGGITTVDLGNGSLTQRNAVMSRTPHVMEVQRTMRHLLTVERARTSTDASTGQENFQTSSGGALVYDTYVVMEDGSEVLRSVYESSPSSYSPKYTTEYIYDQSGEVVTDKSATPVWLTFMIAVETPGTLTAGFNGEVTSGFASFEPFAVNEHLDPTGDDMNGNPRYVEKSYTGYWSGTGDFTIAFTGKCSIYGLRLWSDMELQYATKIRQTDEYIRLEAEARNAMGEAYKSMLEVTACQIQSIVSTSDGRISTVKQTADSVSAEVADARGNNASLRLRIEGVESDVSTISGNVSSLQQTASSLTGYVGSFASGATLAGDFASLLSTAASDATSKMNSAIDSAAADATSKMISAISTAAADALSKANAAKGYADDLDTALRLFVTSGFVAQSDFATMYATAVSGDNTIVKTANMGVYVTWDANTHQIASGAIINADQITFTGKTIDLNSATFTLNASHVNLNGAVTFSMFNQSLQDTINGKTDSSSLGALAAKDNLSQDDITALITAGRLGSFASRSSLLTSDITQAIANAVMSNQNAQTFGALASLDKVGNSNLTSSLKNTISGKADSSSLGAAAYWDDMADAMFNGQTFIVNGYIRASMIDVDNLYATHLSAIAGTIGGMTVDSSGIGLYDSSYSPTSARYFLETRIEHGKLYISNRRSAANPDYPDRFLVIGEKSLIVDTTRSSDSYTVTIMSDSINSTDKALSVVGKTRIQGDLEVVGNINYSGGSGGSGSVTNYGEATSSTYGLIKIGYTQSGKNYPVELSNGKAYVNVPWTDNNTTYTNGNGLSLSGTTFSLADSFTVSGTITAGDFKLGSDERRKNILDDIHISIESIAAAPIKLFTYKDDPKQQLHGGTIAQYWESITPWAVGALDDGFLGVSYSPLGFVNIVEVAREVVKLRDIVYKLIDERRCA